MPSPKISIKIPADWADQQLWMGSGQQWIIWNAETEAWEPPAKARWMECGEPLTVVNRVCTKLLGHGGEHGERADHRSQHHCSVVSVSEDAICHKYAGHPGKHAMRRRTSTNEKLEKRA